VAWPALLAQCHQPRAAGKTGTMPVSRGVTGARTWMCVDDGPVWPVDICSFTSSCSPAIPSRTFIFERPWSMRGRSGRLAGDVLV
jgi:hypothetical protein